jgi:hypothetical protein
MRFAPDLRRETPHLSFATMPWFFPCRLLNPQSFRSALSGDVISRAVYEVEGSLPAQRIGTATCGVRTLNFAAVVDDIERTATTQRLEMFRAFRHLWSDPDDWHHCTLIYRPPVCSAGNAHKSHWSRGRLHEYLDTLSLRGRDLDRLWSFISRPR